MSILLELKGKLKEYFEMNYTILRPVLRFFLALACFLVIQIYLGDADVKVAFLLPVILAFVCSLIPDAFIVYFSALLAAGQAFSISAALGIAMVVIFLVIFLMIGRYDTTQLFIVLAIPLCSIFHVSYVVPIVSALFVGPIVLPAILLGVVIRYLYVGVAVAMTAPNVGMESAGDLAIFQYVVDNFLNSKEMLLSMLAFVLAYMVTYFVRKQKANHASQRAILFGAFVMMGTVLIGHIMIGVDINTLAFMVGMLISVAVAYIIQFFRMTLDYSGTKSLQFEDDEYYYYVKAVPKLKVAIKDKTITRINPKEGEEETDNLQEEFDKVFSEENSKN